MRTTAPLIKNRKRRVSTNTDLANAATLSHDELGRIDTYRPTCKNLAAGMIHLRTNPLLREPQTKEHNKQHLLGHRGSRPGLSFIYIHRNRLNKKYDHNAIFMAGPGHGAPGVLAPV